MTWDITYDEAYDAWDSSTDIDDDVDIRLAVHAWILSWRTLGPPEDADWDPETDTYESAAPGTPVVIQYAVFEGASTRAIFVTGIRSPR